MIEPKQPTNHYYRERLKEAKRVLKKKRLQQQDENYPDRSRLSNDIYQLEQMIKNLKKQMGED